MKLITVVMPVYNGELHLPAAIESILRQSADDFELIVVDDGSTDRTLEVIRGYHDRRVHLLVNPTNVGVTASLNRGLDAAQGVYVARMDADDVSLPDRFAKQVAFLDGHPEIGVCSGGIQGIGVGEGRLWIPPSDHDTIACYLLFDSAFPHPCTMLRTAVLRRFGLRYDATYPYAQDYDLWSRCAAVTRFHNLPEALLLYRRHAASVTEAHAATQRACADRVRRRWLGALGIAPTSAEESLHYDVGHARGASAEGHLEAVERWLRRLLEGNRRTRLLAEGALRPVLADLWRDAGRFVADQGRWTGGRLFFSSLTGQLDLTRVKRLELLSTGIRAGLRARLSRSGAGRRPRGGA